MERTAKEMTTMQGLIVVPVNSKTEGRVIEITSTGFELRDYRKNELKQYCYILIDSCRTGELSFMTAHNDMERVRNLKRRFPRAEYISAECCGIRTA